MYYTPIRIVLGALAGQLWYANNDGSLNRLFTEAMIDDQAIDIRFKFEVRVSWDIFDQPFS